MSDIDGRLADIRTMLPAASCRDSLRAYLIRAYVHDVDSLLTLCNEWANLCQSQNQQAAQSIVELRQAVELNEEITQFNARLIADKELLLQQVQLLTERLQEAVRLVRELQGRGGKV